MVLREEEGHQRNDSSRQGKKANRLLQAKAARKESRQRNASTSLMLKAAEHQPVAAAEHQPVADRRPVAGKSRPVAARRMLGLTAAKA